MAASALTLILTVFTGVLTARLLKPVGRGELAAIAGWVTTLALFASLGAKEAVTYLQSKESAPAGSILTTSVLCVSVLSVMGVALAELLVPIGFSSQSVEVARLVRVYLLMAIPIMMWEGLIGIMNGHLYFFASSTARVGQLLMTAVGLFLLWQADRISVGSVLFVQSASHVITAAALAVFLARRVGFGRFSLSLARKLLAHGVRLHAGTLGSIGNSRLDIVVMPAVLPAEAIGLYAVAVSAGSIVVALFGELRAVVFPLAARRGISAGMTLVEMTLRFTLAGALVIGTLLAVSGSTLIRILYGEEFLGAVPALRILLPGLVLWSGASILVGGLNASGGATRSSLAQLAGLVLTAGGLLVSLPRLGIHGAALTSTLVYATVFGLLLVFLSGQPEFSPVRALSPFRLIGDVRRIIGRVRMAAPPATLAPSSSAPEDCDIASGQGDRQSDAAESACESGVAPRRKDLP